jgi:hypothetical protein
MGSVVALQLERLGEMRAAFGPDARRTSGLTLIIREGTRVYANLQAYVHHEPADPRFAQREAARWLHFAHHVGTGFERKVLHQGVEQRSQED